MATSVSSKFTNGFWFKGLGVSAFAFCLITAWINYLINNKDSSLLLIFSLAFFIIIYIYFTIRALREITIAPEGLIVKYLLINRKVTFKYEDIVHIKNLRMDRFDQGYYLYLVIEFANGKSIKFKENDIDNYDELKEAIRRNRFSLEDEKKPLGGDDVQK